MAWRIADYVEYGDIALEQTGVVGDITAARKVKVLEIEGDCPL